MKKLTTSLIVVLFLAMSSSAFAWDKETEIRVEDMHTSWVAGTLYSSGTVTADVVGLRGKVVKEHWAVIDRQIFFAAYTVHHCVYGEWGNPNYDSVIFDDKYSYDSYRKGKVSGTCWVPHSQTFGIPIPWTVRHYYYV